MSDLCIGEGTEVTLHFAIKLDDGSIVDSNFEKEPATFVVGDKNLLEGFEKLLHGLSAGEKATFDVLPEHGFGQRNPNNIQEISRDAFDDSMELTEGLVVSFADANNNELPGAVQSFTDDLVMVDFNHPLSGRNLVFDVEILEVKPSTTH
ncbi:MAG: FKBP-type peptidyl-prolyl cis-trans isomerase [Cellvibrionaceae bacterium]